MNTKTDEQIMHLVATDQLDELAVLFERYNKHVYNFIVQMTRDRDVSEDITQEVFYKILKYRHTYNGGVFKTWMFTIARNSLANHYKKAPKNVTLEVVGAAEGYDDEYSKEMYTNLHWALSRLGEADRELIILNRLQEIKYEELAIIVNSTPNAVKTRVSRAMEKLRKVYFNK